jgi:hypothetical protein
VRWIDDRCYEFTVGFHPGFLATQLDVYLGMTTLLHPLYAVFDAVAAVALKLYECGLHPVLRYPGGKANPCPSLSQPVNTDPSGYRPAQN